MKTKKSKSTQKKSTNLKAQAAKIKKIKQQLKVAEGKVKSIAKKGEQKIKAAQAQLKSRVERVEQKVKELKISLEKLDKVPVTIEKDSPRKAKAKPTNAKKSRKFTRNRKTKGEQSASEIK